MPAYAQTSNTKPAARGAPSAAEAKAFVDNAERDLANVSVYANKAQWVYETYINADTSFLARIIHDSTSFFISPRCTRAIYLS